MDSFKKALLDYLQKGKLYEAERTHRVRKKVDKESARPLSCMEKPTSYILYEGRK